MGTDLKEQTRLDSNPIEIKPKPIQTTAKPNRNKVTIETKLKSNQDLKENFAKTVEAVADAKLSQVAGTNALSSNSKTMIRSSRGTKGYIVSDEEDEQGRVMIYVDANEIVLIDKEEILDLGFN